MYRLNQAWVQGLSKGWVRGAIPLLFEGTPHFNPFVFTV